MRVFILRQKTLLLLASADCAFKKTRRLHYDDEYNDAWYDVIKNFVAARRESTEGNWCSYKEFPFFGGS